LQSPLGSFSQPAGLLQSGIREVFSRALISSSSRAREAQFTSFCRSTRAPAERERQAIGDHSCDRSACKLGVIPLDDGEEQIKYANIFRIAGGALIVLIGLLQGAGGLQLLKGGPAAWPDIRADEIVVRRSAYALIIFAVLSLITGGAVMNGVPWSDLGAA